MNYHCGKCKLAVIVVGVEKPIKACTCDAPIIAEMEANLSIKNNVINN